MLCLTSVIFQPDVLSQDGGGCGLWISAVRGACDQPISSDTSVRTCNVFDLFTEITTENRCEGPLMNHLQNCLYFVFRVISHESFWFVQGIRDDV